MQEKLNSEMERKLRSQKSALEVIIISDYFSLKNKLEIPW